MKAIKYIKEILVVLLIIGLLYSIYLYMESNSEIKKQKDIYVEVQKKNEITQKESNKTIATLRDEIVNINSKLHLLKSKKDLVRVEIKWKTSWKTKVIRDIKYVTLPATELSLTLKENILLKELVLKWKLTAEEWMKKYTSEVTVHESCRTYVIALEKKNKRSVVKYGIIGTLFGIALYGIFK